MKTSQKGLELIKKFEGFSDKKYICPSGKITIGYGHVVLPNEKFPRIITKDDAEVLLKKDLEAREQSLNNLIKVKINQNQFDAIISLVYNIGIDNFRKSTILKLINTNLFDKIPEQFRRWRFSNKKELKGLVTRREEEIKLWLG